MKQGRRVDGWRRRKSDRKRGKRPANDLLSLLIKLKTRRNEAA